MYGESIAKTEMSYPLLDLGEFGQSLTNIDAYLVDCQLDLEEAIKHPQLEGMSHEEIENSIEAIYVAANYGNAYAKFLIETAAHSQWRDETDADKKMAFGEPMQVSDEQLAEYAASYVNQKAETAKVREMPEITNALIVRSTGILRAKLDETISTSIPYDFSMDDIASN